MSLTIDELLIKANKATFDSVLKFWQFHVLSGTPINEEKAIAAYKKMYDADDFVFAKSPYALQKEANRATSLSLGVEHTTFNDDESELHVKSMTDEISKLTGNIFNRVQSEIDSEFKGRNSVYERYNQWRHENISYEKGTALIDIARENAIMEAKYKHINYLDFNSIIALDFLTKIGVANSEAINCLIELALAGVYGLTVFGTDKVIFLSLPSISFNEERQISSNKKMAIAFPDNWGVAMWKGLRIPNKYVTEPITKKVIMNERNAEYKRCIKEMVGNETFAKLLDLTCIHEDFDDRGNIMRLMRSKETDSAIQVDNWSDKDDRADGHLYFLHVVCPSTMREYYLCVKPTRDVWKAKESLFQNRPIMYRHGDVGLLNLKKAYERPISES